MISSASPTDIAARACRSRVRSGSPLPPGAGTGAIRRRRRVAWDKPTPPRRTCSVFRLACSGRHRCPGLLSRRGGPAAIRKVGRPTAAAIAVQRSGTNQQICRRRIEPGVFGRLHDCPSRPGRRRPADGPRRTDGQPPLPGPRSIRSAHHLIRRSPRRRRHPGREDPATLPESELLRRTARRHCRIPSRRATAADDLTGTSPGLHHGHRRPLQVGKGSLSFSSPRSMCGTRLGEVATGRMPAGASADTLEEHRHRSPDKGGFHWRAYVFSLTPPVP